MSDESLHDAPGPGTATMPTGSWRPLPAQARRLFVLGGLWLALPAAFAGAVLGAVFDLPGRLFWIPLLALAAGLWGAWLGLRRYRSTAWRLDDAGFSLRRGRLWQSDLRVPRNRVQHLDLRRGPIERRLGLATLVIHTAGTRDASVHVGGLAEADAERLRDTLARQSAHG